MIDWDDDKQKEMLLRDYAPLSERFEGLDYSATVTASHWKELWIVLAEESLFNPGWAKRLVGAFLLYDRRNDKGLPRTDVPSAPELRAFARQYAEKNPPDGEPPSPCELCAPCDGLWKLAEKNGVTVTVPCDCARGQFLARRKEAMRKRRL